MRKKAEIDAAKKTSKDAKRRRISGKQTQEADSDGDGVGDLEGDDIMALFTNAGDDDN